MTHPGYEDDAIDIDIYSHIRVFSSEIYRYFNRYFEKRCNIERHPLAFFTPFEIRDPQEIMIYIWLYIVI